MLRLLWPACANFACSLPRTGSKGFEPRGTAVTVTSPTTAISFMCPSECLSLWKTPEGNHLRDIYFGSCFWSMVIWTHGFEPEWRRKSDSHRKQVGRAARLGIAMEQDEGEEGVEDKIHPFRASLQWATSPSWPHLLLFAISHRLITLWIYQKNELVLKVTSTRIHSVLQGPRAGNSQTTPWACGELFRLRPQQMLNCFITCTWLLFCLMASCPILISFSLQKSKSIQTTPIVPWYVGTMLICILEFSCLRLSYWQFLLAYPKVKQFFLLPPLLSI